MAKFHELEVQFIIQLLQKGGYLQGQIRSQKQEMSRHGEVLLYIILQSDDCASNSFPFMINCHLLEVDVEKNKANLFLHQKMRASKNCKVVDPYFLLLKWFVFESNDFCDLTKRHFCKQWSHLSLFVLSTKGGLAEQFFVP